MKELHYDWYFSAPCHLDLVNISKVCLCAAGKGAKYRYVMEFVC